MQGEKKPELPAWRQWSPGLGTDDNTLGEIVATLPGNEPQQIHPIVRLFENPKSPIAFKGAVSLRRHDMIHILLGRGLLPQDEAFVIGFTMGTSKTISALESWLFEKITQYFYPPPYNFKEAHLKVFELGVEAGKQSDASEIYNQPLEERLDETIGALRHELGIRKSFLRDYFAKERALMPESVESQRLDAA